MDKSRDDIVLVYHQSGDLSRPCFDSPPPQATNKRYSNANTRKNSGHCIVRRTSGFSFSSPVLPSANTVPVRRKLEFLPFRHSSTLPSTFS